MNNRILDISALLLSALVARASTPERELSVWFPAPEMDIMEFDTIMPFPVKVRLFEQPDRHWLEQLTEQDYRDIAAEMGVEVAAIKAVVDIETGNVHRGFSDDGRALINFDQSIYRQRLARSGLSINRARAEAPEAFGNLNISKYGSRQAAQWARLESAMAFDEDTALESAFWGMFQVGGFNWKECGCNSVREYVDLIGRSERDQLELFARFCRSRNLIRFIRAKDWEGFALRYNGNGYKKMNYHTKMAAAYRKYSRK